MRSKPTRETKGPAGYPGGGKCENRVLQLANNRLTSEVAELRSEIEFERKQQANDIEKYENKKKDLQSPSDQLKVELTELRKSTEIKRYQQAISLRECEDSIIALKALNDHCIAENTELKSALLGMATTSDSWENLKKVPQSSMDVSKMELVGRNSKLLKRKIPTIGTFHTSEAQSYKRLSRMIEFVKAVSFTKSYLSVLAIPLGLTSLHSQNRACA